jgi:hemolysin activation/secretion protein
MRGVYFKEARCGKRRMLRGGWALRVGVLLALSLADLTAPEGAVAGPSAPASVPNQPTPGQIESTLPALPSLPQIKSAPLTNTQAPSSTEVPPGGPAVAVSGFDIIGNTVFDTATLQSQVASYVGKDLTLAELYKVAAVLTRYYQDHGYGVARATLPQQQLSGGHVTLQVVEGRIGKVSVDGNTRTRSGTILAQGSAVQSGDVYTDAAMDRASLLVNDLPAIQAQAVLAPGADFGTADVTYKVTEDSEYSGQVSVDDYGRPDVGRWRLNGEAGIASLTGSGDRLTADVTHSEHDQLNFGALRYSLPLGAAGGRLNASYNQSHYYVTGAFTDLGLSGGSKNANLAYQYPLIRSHDTNFYWGAGFEHQGSDSIVNPFDPVTHKSAGGAKVTETELNLVQLTGFFTRSHEDGSSYNLSGSFASNGERDDGLKGSAERARFELDSGYTKPIADAWTFVARASAVWSPDPLSDTEKFSLGGPDDVRGFPSADVRGDSGVFASAEIQRTLAPAWPLALGWYVDAGKAWTKQFSTVPAGCKPSTDPKTFNPCISPQSAQGISSVGAELIFQSPGKRWEFRLEWAYAVGGTRPSDGDEAGHIWATFGMNF